MSAALKVVEPQPIRIDIGCGKNKRPEFIGIDAIAFEGVDHVLDVTTTPLPFEAGTVDEVYSSHFVEHLDRFQRCAFFNELYRVMKVGAKALIITPHASHARAYGDPTHQWPAITEWFYPYLNRTWRESQAPHSDAKYWAPGYNCDFESVGGSSWDPNHEDIKGKNEHMMRFATRNFRDVCQDLHMTLTKR